MYNAFLNVLKPPGMTSHDVVGFLRRVYGQKKIGHAGTLDPAAAGVLPVALGQATRLLEYITDAGKTYRAELTLGYATDSGDDTGKVIGTAPFTMPDPAVIQEVLQSFCGANTQKPPMYSAIKVNGAKLYELARQGITLDVPARTVHIERISLLSVNASQILFDVTCSKGTYIRTLCIDIGTKLNSLAVMSFLIRTGVGSFCLQDAYTLEEIQNNPPLACLSMEDVLSQIPAVHLDEKQALAFRQGQRIYREAQPDAFARLRVYGENRDFIGIGKYSESAACIIPTKVIAR